VNLGCTEDLLAHRAVQSALGVPRLAVAVHGDLGDTRMRVLPHHLDWVVALIGDARASECACLPDGIRRQAGEKAQNPSALRPGLLRKALRPASF
jgi:hypothetical protein